MSLTGAALNRFRARVDEVIEDFFPCVLVISAQNVDASGPGGRTVSEYMDGGESENFRFPFRVLKSAVPSGWTPVKGGSINWKVDADTTLLLEIQEVSVRPHEDRYHFACRRRRQ